MNPVIKRIDALLNSITMYRLLLYGLIILLALASFFGFTGVLAISGWGIIAVTTTLVVASYLTNKLLGKLYRAATNTESFLITALILACILPPSTTLTRLLYVALAGVIATASKFVLSYRHKHVFNPAAIAAVAITLLGVMPIAWWIGNPTMLPFVAIFGLFIIRKVHRFKLVLVFLLASTLMMVLISMVSGSSAVTLIKSVVEYSPLVFFATVMLTEPATMPVLQYYQLLYGLLIGALFTAQLHWGVLSTSPHMVLAFGNIFAYIVNPKFKANLKLKAKNRISAQVYDFVFTPDRPLKFIPGQYMEWTLPYHHVDGRGNRRSFTIASSPTEADVHLGVKFYEPSSSFKKALQAMHLGDGLAAGQLSGNFILPQDLNKKLVFVAGGIGITPFRSMAKYMTDSHERRDVALFYLVGKAEELAFTDIFKATPGLDYIPIVGGSLTPDLLASSVSGYKQRTFYISGPNGLVESYRALLRKSGVPATQIITDYFSGY